MRARKGRTPVERATDMIRGHIPLERIHRCTGLPMDIIERLRGDVNATRRSERELWKLSQAAMRPLCPCPACDTGHGSTTHFRWGFDEPCNMGYVVRCSNPKCIAMTVFPHHSKDEATEMFVTNRLTDQPVEYRPELRPYGIERLLANIAASSGASAERMACVFQLDPALTGRIMMEASIITLRHNPEQSADASLICPECGSIAQPRRIQNGHQFLGWQYRCEDPRHEPLRSKVCHHRKEAAEAFRDRHWNKEADHDAHSEH